MLGAIAGDIIGSVHEFSSNSRDDFPLFHQDCSPTDDSLLTCGIAEACLAGSTDYRAHLLSAFQRAEARTTHPPIGPGWGTGFHDWASSEAEPGRTSFGNGSAMRVSAIAWAYDSEKEVLGHARLSALPSHAHPEGIKGSECTALAIWTARRTRDPKAVRAVAERFYGKLPSLAVIRRKHVYSETCQDCVPVAMAIAVGTDNFEQCVRLACSIRGDADTLAAIAGSVSEGLWGLPEPIAAEAMARLRRWYPWAASLAERGKSTWLA
jgi:ADP-ribosylglycohydrolase